MGDMGGRGGEWGEETRIREREVRDEIGVGGHTRADHTKSG